MLHQAAAALEEAGYSVIGAWLSPSHDGYLQPKARSLNTVGLSAAFRLEAARRTLQSDPLVELGSWEASQPGRWPDFPEVCHALQSHLDAHGLPGPVAVFYACGTDHAHKCGLNRGMGHTGVVIVPRDGESAGESRPEKRVYVAAPALGEVSSFSSTKVRAALGRSDSAYIARALSEEAAEFLLCPTPEELAQFSADYAKLGVESSVPKSEPATAGELEHTQGEPRQVWISLSMILRAFEQQGEQLFEQIAENALFLFGSQRSWVFPETPDQLQESRFQNPRYTHPQYQPVRDLILRKEAAGCVFFLKPPGFKYNGGLHEGHPDAFLFASEWLTSLSDPVTGLPYKPLLLDPSWWRTEFGSEEAEHSRDAELIIKNFSNGAHDYGPLMELLAQSNPNLDIVLSLQ